VRRNKRTVATIGSQSKFGRTSAPFALGVAQNPAHLMEGIDHKTREVGVD